MGFIRLGIPTSAIFTGAGDPWDPCYHQACDSIDNIHWEALTTNARAAARALATLAHSLEGVPPRQTTSPNRRGRKRMVQNFKEWVALADEASHKPMCAHRAGKQLT